MFRWRTVRGSRRKNQSDEPRCGGRSLLKEDGYSSTVRLPATPYIDVMDCKTRSDLSSCSMLSTIIRSLRAWVQRFRRRGTPRPADGRLSPPPSSDSQTSAGDSPNVPTTAHSPKDTGPRKPDTVKAHGSTAPVKTSNDVVDADSRTEPSDCHSEEAQSSKPDEKAARDNPDAADGQDDISDTASLAEAGRPTPGDGESAKVADVVHTDSFRHVPTETVPTESKCDTSEEPASDAPKDTPNSTDSPPTEPAGNPLATALGNADANGSSQPDETAPPSDPPKGALPSGGKVSDENAQSTKGTRHRKKTKPRVPREIGGRRKRPATSNPPVTNSGKDEPTFVPRPELVCRRASGSWQLVLLAGRARNIAQVRQNGANLDIVNGECRLSSFAGRSAIIFGDGRRDEFPLFDGTPPIFKLRKNWKGDGRKVGGMTSGHFIVIAPKEWHRRGDVPVEPEGCTDPGFVAHYFFRGKGDSLENVTGFEECAVPLTTSSFDLIGNHVFDDSEEGELCIGPAAPDLRLSPGIVWVRVGEEKPKGWGETFRPAEKTLARVLEGRQGQFFLRVYDDSKLRDSGEFRYFAGLQSILVDGAHYSETSLLVPPSTGHSPTEIRFVGAEGKLVHPRLETGGPWATVRADGTVVIKPHPDGDALSCILGSDDDGVHVDIVLPRIWWRMKRSDGEHEEWRDTPLVMTRQEFRDSAYANEAIRLRLPAPLSSVNVGFDEESDRAYRRAKEGREVEIPLTDFVDYSQIDRRLNDDALFNVRCRGTVLSLIRVSADPVPTIDSFTCEPTQIDAGETATLSWKTRNAEPGDVVIDPGGESVAPNGSLPVTPSEPTPFTLRLSAPGMDDVTKALTLTVRIQPPKSFPRVKGGNGGYRRGKGFSPGEVRAAGLTVAYAARLSFPVDRRRRSTHQVNLDTIERRTDA